MISHGGYKHILLKPIKKAFNRLPQVFQKYVMALYISSKIAAF